MDAPTIRMLPARVAPGLHIHLGQFQARLEDDLGTNQHREPNLWHPERVRHYPARPVPLAEWRQS